MKLSIVIPVYNEKNTIREVLSLVEKVDLPGIEKEIIIIDDNSNDGTSEILHSLKDEYKIIFKEKNEGKGSAVKLGFQEATGDIILIQDADLEYNPEEYMELITPIIDGKADVVYGSRFISNKPHRVLYFWHSIGNRFLTLLSNTFTNLTFTDMETCYKAFNRRSLDLIKGKIKSKRFGIEPEITALISRNNLKIYEVGVSYYGRTYQEGKKISWKDGLAAVYYIIKFNLFGWLKHENLIKILKSSYFLLLILAVANLLIAFFFVQYPLQLNGDAPSYINAMNLIQGNDREVLLYGSEWETQIITNARIVTTPLMLYSSIFASEIIGGDGYAGMLVVNIIFYFLIIFVFYKLVLAIYKVNKVAVIASILFFTNYCLYNYGVTYRTDMGGWFFFLLATLFAVYYYQCPTKEKFFYLSVLASSIGVLFKEYGFLGLVSLGFLILLSPIQYGNKIKKILKTGLLFLIIPALYYIFIYLKFDYSYLDWYFFNVNAIVVNPESPEIRWTILLLIKVLSWLFLIGWPIFLLGIYWEYKDRNRERIKVLLALLPASLAFLAWPALTQRIAFIFIPWLAMISGYGLSKMKSKYLVVIIIVIYILVGYLIRNSYLSWDLLRIINF